MSAKKVIREQRFDLLLPADEFSNDESFRKIIENEKLAVQGVIDLILVDNNNDLYLYDYKTDRLTKEELANDLLAEKKFNKLHGLQLSYYEKAVNMLFGHPCKRVAVYSTHAAKSFNISTIPLTLPNKE